MNAALRGLFIGPEMDLMLGFVVISTIVGNCCDAMYKEKTYSEFNIKYMLNFKLKFKTIFLNKKECLECCLCKRLC